MEYLAGRVDRNQGNVHEDWRLIISVKHSVKQLNSKVGQQQQELITLKSIDSARVKEVENLQQKVPRLKVKIRTNKELQVSETQSLRGEVSELRT